MNDPRNGGRASDALFREVYDELHALAARQLRGQRKDHTLQASALVHEAWLRFADAKSDVIGDREHFLAIAATAMRQVLVDHARKKRAQKRGKGAERVSLHESRMSASASTADVVELDDALKRLEALDARKARVVELRVFGGMTIEETAAALGVSHMTVSTDWRFACAWLGRELEGEPR